ncbi:hypothetical protein VitviT2T_024464 [Vitis vinifera]|uniref:Aminotransferase-like plant mobile domain-containing protein n=1 Tax=Vitis vinifera TaxID=29760 RepID=A0ABY9DIJ3_VITVI|nr:hypothetical protein VitviT2T_024464 [Vitis vinifera]
MFLLLVEDFGVTGTYSWGSTFLTWLYREMCRASRIDAHDALGPLILLQLWDRFPFITPMRLHSALHDGILPQPPLGMRWRDEFCTTSTPMHVLPQYRYLLDRLMPEQERNSLF